MQVTMSKNILQKLEKIEYHVKNTYYVSWSHIYFWKASADHRTREVGMVAYIRKNHLVNAGTLGLQKWLEPIWKRQM